MMRSVASLLVTGVLAFALPAFAAEPVAVGQPAPAFKLKDEAGKDHSLEQYKGKIVVLEWTNPECPYVKRHYEADTMEKLSKGLDAKKVVWLAVDSTSHNTPAKSAEWKKAQGLTYPILQDASGEVGKLFGAKTTPHMYVIDATGVLRFAGGIDDDPRGKKDAPVNHVQAAVEALIGGKVVPVTAPQPYGCSVKYKAG